MWVFSEFVTVISHLLGVMTVTFLKSATLDKTFIGKFKVSQKIGNLQKNKTKKKQQKRIFSLSCLWAHILKAVICCGWWIYFISTIFFFLFCTVLYATLTVLIFNAFLHFSLVSFLYALATFLVASWSFHKRRAWLF